MSDPIDLSSKLATFSEHFAPRTLATLNDYDVMVAKLLGPFIWHKHDETDDFFLVIPEAMPCWPKAISYAR